ncbi:MAG: hypothetical protein ISR47_05435 [Rhodospirillales bacterium]|nr:hypothetical protein [Rhodospirillales bacterium]
MVEIDAPQLNGNAYRMGGYVSASSLTVTSLSATQETTITVRARSIHDTVDLSAEGQKAVNLAQGEKLADEIRYAPTDESFADKLEKAREDIFRIGRLFLETLKSSYFFRR